MRSIKLQGGLSVRKSAPWRPVEGSCRHGWERRAMAGARQDQRSEVGADKQRDGGRRFAVSQTEKQQRVEINCRKD